MFVFSALVKAVDPMGTQYKIADYFTAWDLSISDNTALALAIALITFEFVVGVVLVLHIYKRCASWAAIGLMAVMTPITLWLAMTDAVADCGCFGDAIVLTNWQTFEKNVVLLALAILTLFVPSMEISFIGTKARKILAGLGTLGIIALIGHCLYWLPIIDFRPFNVGADIRAKMEFPEDGSMPEILDFCIESLDGEDVTEEILDSKDVVLLVAPFLQTVDIKDSILYNNLASDAKKRGKQFYCLTSSSEEEIAKWRKATGANYGIYHADDIMLKTMIRSNPGIMELENGVVTGKWSHRQFTDLRIYGFTD